MSRKVSMDLGRGFTRVPYGVQDHARAPHKVAAGKHAGQVCHLVGIHYQAATIVGSQLA